jgi:DNA (cytosine-5)-methyltransferase 1
MLKSIKQYQSSFLSEMIIDYFCGGGGASTGIETALGRIVDLAVNHDAAAIGMHAANHIFTRHIKDDVFHVDIEREVNGRKVLLLWGSPDCTHFSKAKGGTPVKKEIRGLAWVLVRVALLVRPQIIMLENVPEFTTWGPLTPENRPDKSKRGETFREFINALKALGYDVDWRVLSADDYGAGTTRKRLHLIARCDGQPIVFPAPTHGDAPGLLPKRTAAEYIDFSLRGKSIFNRKKPLAIATQKRIARGLDKFTIRAKKPFIIQTQFNNMPQDAFKPLTTICGVNKHSVVEPKYTPFVMCNNNNNVGTAANEPLHTITGGNRHYLTEGKLAPYLIQYHSETTARENRAYSVTDPIKVINGSPRYGLTSAYITKYYGGNYRGAGSATNAPLDSITAIDHNALVESHLCIFRRGADCRPLTAPLPTLTAAAEHFAEIKTYLLKYDPVADLGNWEQVRKLLNDYAGYAIAVDEVLIIEIDGTPYFISDIEMRMLTPKEPYGCQGFPPDYVFDRTADGKPLSKAEQIKKVGNSVCPPVATALVRANLPELCGASGISTMRELMREVAVV